MKQLFLFILAAAGSLNSMACRCHRAIFTQEVAQSDLIFIGTVLKKDSSDKAYYLFAVSKVFKGSYSDTVTISTGFGGPDCGMKFETGTTYLVYANHKRTSWCSRNHLANSNTDEGKLKYLFDSSFSNETGKNTDPLLTASEAAYFNSELLTQRNQFDFRQKKVAFVSNRSLINKQRYFTFWGGKDAVNNLLILTETEKQQCGYDAIIVSWNKQVITDRFRRRLVKQLTLY